MNKHLVVGLGEIGNPIYQILKEGHGDGVYGYDPKIASANVLPTSPIYSLHICIPWGNNFIGVVQTYQTQYKPIVTVIHSTVPVGTSHKLGAVHSPVLGKHPNLYEDIKKFTKWFGGTGATVAASLFEKCGLATRVVIEADLTEFLKLACLAKYGLAITFADYLNRVCLANGFDYTSVTHWDMDYNAGVAQHLHRPLIVPPEKNIGGHCVIPGTNLLNQQFPNELLEQILKLQ